MTPLAPRGDNLPKKTWRPNEDLAAARANHAYPQAGCQGEPLSQECGACGGSGIVRLRQDWACFTCNGTGRVLRSGWDTPHCG